MFLFLLLTDHGNVVPALIFGVFAFALYVPSGYYLESYLFNRRMRKRSAVEMIDVRMFTVGPVQEN